MRNQQRVSGASRRLVLRRGGIAWALAALAGRAPAAGAAQPSTAGAADLVRDWPAAAKAAAEATLRKYGPPQEATPTRLIWENNAPWKRTIAHKTGVEHDFPAKHMDVLEQVVEYRVPLNFFEALAKFDGSVLADRTRGELAAFCDREATNILALNLARDIIRGEKNVEQARDAMTSGMREIQAGRIPDDARELRLGPPQGDLRDPDTPAVQPGQNQTAPTTSPARIR